MGFNEFSGNFPEEMLRLEFINMIILHHNRISGTIADAISPLTSLQVFDISNNLFSGNAPSGTLLSNAPLVQYDISLNNFTGPSLSEFLLQRSALFPPEGTLVIPILATMDLSHNPFKEAKGDDVLEELLQLLFNHQTIFFLDASDTPITSPTKPFGEPWNPYFGLSPELRAYPELSLACHKTVYGGQDAVASAFFPPAFWNYTNCACLNQFWGKPPDCKPCPANMLCKEDKLFIPGGLYPVLDPKNKSFLGFLPCKGEGEGGEGETPCKGIALEYGDDGFEEEICEHGYTGRLCRECVCEHGEAHCYFPVGSKCVECKPLETWMIVGGAVSLIFCIFIFIFLKGSTIVILLEAMVVVVLLLLGIGESYIFDVVVFFVIIQGLEALGKGGSSVAHVVSLEGLAKLFLWYLQALNLLTPSELWPETVKSTISSMDFVNFHSSSIECMQFFRELSESVGREVAKLLIVITIPLLLAVTMIVTLGLRRMVYPKVKECVAKVRPKKEMDSYLNSDDSFLDTYHGDVNSSKRETHDPSFYSEVASMTIFVGYATLVEVSASVLEALPCTPDPFTKEDFMSAAPAISCTSHEYQTLQKVAWPLFAVWVLGLPLFFGFLLFFNRKNLKNHDTEEWLGLLYENYTHECWWWEMVWLLRRLLLAVAVSWFEESPWKNALISSLLVGSICLSFVFRPFQFPMENIFEVGITAVLLVTWTSSFCEVSEGLRWTIAVVNFLMCICFFLLFAYKPIKGLKKRCIES